MTDWIGNLVAKLSADQRDRNQQHAIDILHDQLITAKAPDFFNQVAQAVMVLGEELNLKLGASLGGVKAEATDEQFSIANNGPFHSVKLVGRLDVRGHQIKVTTQHKSPRYVPGDGMVEPFALRIGTEDRLTVFGLGRQFHDPVELASAILATAFNADLLRQLH